MCRGTCHLWKQLDWSRSLKRASYKGKATARDTTCDKSPIPGINGIFLPIASLRPSCRLALVKVEKRWAAKLIRRVLAVAVKITNLLLECRTRSSKIIYSFFLTGLRHPLPSEQVFSQEAASQVQCDFLLPEMKKCQPDLPFHKVLHLREFLIG